jgi:hypothetical protein
MRLHSLPSLALLLSATTIFASPLTEIAPVMARQTDDTTVVLTFTDFGNVQYTVHLDCAEGESQLVRVSDVVPGHVTNTWLEFTATPVGGATYDVSVEGCKNSPNPPSEEGDCIFDCSETGTSGHFSCGGGDTAYVLKCLPL